MNVSKRIITILVSVLIISSIAMLTNTVFQTNDLKRSVAEEIVNASDDESRMSMDLLLIPIVKQLELVRDWSKSGEFVLDKDNSFYSKFYPILSAFENLNGILLADNDGRFLSISREDSLFYLERNLYPSRVKLYEKYAYDGISSMKIKNLKKVYSDKNKEGYDPRRRPWFIGATDSVIAGNVYWTNQYKFFSSDKLGITASVNWVSHSDSGGWKSNVVGFDIFLSDIVKQLSANKAVKNGFVAILLQNPHLLIFEDTVITDKTEVFDVFQQVVLGKENARLSQGVNKNKLAMYTVDGKSYWYKIFPIVEGVRYFEIAVVIPDDDVTSRVWEIQKRIIYLALAILIVSILLVLVIFKMYIHGVNLENHVEQLMRAFSNSGSIEAFVDYATESICKIMKADNCSIYFFDKEQNELMLVSSINQGLPKIVEYGIGELGFVFKNMKPYINNDKGHYAIYAPVVRGINKIGIISIYRDKKRFSKKDFSVFIDMEVQLTSILETSSRFFIKRKKTEVDIEFDESVKKISGIVASPGYAKALSYVDIKDELWTSYRDKHWSRVFSLKDFEQNVEVTIEELDALQVRMESILIDNASLIFMSHILMLRDESFYGRIEKLILNGINPPEAIIHVSDELISSFLNNDISVIKEKADDIKDIAIRLLSQFVDTDEANRNFITDRIVIAKELLPSDILVMSIKEVKGIVLNSGGTTSHISILCRSLNIPLIITDNLSVFGIKNGTELLLDGNHGVLYVNPSEGIIADYNKLLEPKEYLEQPISNIIKTIDNKEIALSMNINLLTDVINGLKFGISNIGLMRSEFTYMIRTNFPTENEQYNVYKKVAEKINGSVFTIRTLDIGGDKILSYYNDVKEDNPFLGFRAIRFSLEKVDVFKEQLSAIVRAGVGTDLKIMFPMISSLDEVRRAKQILQEVLDKLKAEGVHDFVEKPKVGIMVEIPAVVNKIDSFAKEVDFMSIGTNDLVQYTLAVDRTNSKVANMYISHHPSVLSSIAKVAESAKKHNVEVSLCGDMASHEEYIPFLIGVGIRILSVDAIFIERVRTCIENLDFEHCKKMAEKILSCNSVEEVEELL